MNNHANTSDKLMDIDLKWVFKEEIVLGIVLTSWHGCRGSKAFSNFLDAHRNTDLFQCGSSGVSGEASLPEQYMYIFVSV